MKISKLTTGYVIQTYDTKTGQCIEQSFVAGDDVAYEDGCGNPIDWEEEPEANQPFDMVQPKVK